MIAKPKGKNSHGWERLLSSYNSMAACSKIASMIRDVRLPKDSIIIQVGNYPPPYGGISMRIKRISKLINKTGAKGFVFTPKGSAINKNVISLRRFAGIMLGNLWRKEKDRILVHLQHTNLRPYRAKWYVFIIFVQLCAGKVVISLGALWHDIGKLPFYKQFWFKSVTKRIDCYIAVGQDIAKKLIDGGCPKEKVRVIPGFVPPDEEELMEESGISAELKLFLEKSKPIIAANASGIVFYEGRDLYGLDVCIELISRLRKKYPNLGLIYAVAPGGHGALDDWNYLERMTNLSHSLALEENFYIRVCSKPFTPLLKHCDIFVRPTCTDGDANSIREALYLGKPVVASDVVLRPEGCLVYKDGDVNDFIEKVGTILSDYRSHEKRINELNISFPHRDLLRLYSQVLEP